MTFRLTSPKRAEEKFRVAKPETIIIVESNGIREREPGEAVHWRSEPGEACSHCGSTIGIWMDSYEQWMGREDVCR